MALEDEGAKFLRNFGNRLSTDATSYSRTESATTPPWKLKTRRFSRPSTGIGTSDPCFTVMVHFLEVHFTDCPIYEGWNFNSGNHLFTTDTK